MKTLKIIFVVLVTLVIVLAAGFFLIGYLKPKPGGIRVNSAPVSSVYVNGAFVGKTPYSGTNPATQINLKLVPDSGGQNLFPYETKVNLASGIETAIDREFGTSEDNSSGDVISFDRIGGDLAGLVVISTPDNAQVWIDRTSQGFSPYNFNSITTGTHKITIKSQGYFDRTMSVKTLAGFRLTVFAKLAKNIDSSSLPSPSPTPQNTIKSFVVIGNTPTGFLRMRTEPGTLGEEIAELKPGQKYLYLDTDLASGWFKIQYQDPAPGLPNGITGWISNQYSSLSTPSASLTPPAPTPQ